MPFRQRISLFLLTLMTSALIACGGSSGGGGNNNNDGNTDDPDDNPPTAQTLSGAAATGDPIEGFIYLTDRNGDPGTSVAYDIEANGRYEIDVSSFTPPFMLKAQPNDGSAAQFSYAAEAGVANITPMTTLALFEATERADIEALFSSWSESYTQVSVEAVVESAQAIAASFQAQLVANGVDPASFDIFSTPFAADQTGFDAVLDNTSVSIDLDGGTVTVNGETFEIPTDLPDVPDIPDVPEGDWTLVVTGEFNGQSIRPTSISGVPAPTQAQVEQGFSSQFATEASGLDCSNVQVNSETNTDTRVVFNLSASCTQQGFDISYNLTYTYTR